MTTSSSPPVRLAYRLGIYLVLLIGCVSVAVINGQPFFYYDTSAYVEGPDAAVGRLFGDNFRTVWTQKTTSSSPAAVANPSRAGASAEPAKETQPRQPIITGRSLYYGMLVYVGHLTSHFWLTVFVQAIIFI